MKKITMILMAFVMMFFTQCKPEPETDNTNTTTDTDSGKVRVSCTIPINKGDRSDFSGLFEDGVINWSDGREYVYLAIPGDEPKVVELKGYSDGYKPEIEFIAYVDEHLLMAGESYDIWYFGHSQQLDSAYVSLVDGNKIVGSIAKQTGRLEDLGYSHIASTSVKAVMENGEVKLPLVGTLKNRMAIALLDLENLTTGLFGSAVNTDYTLEYNAATGKFEFNVIEDENASIEVEEGMSGISYIAFLPNGNTEVELKCRKYADYEYVFYNGIKENKIYYRIELDDSMTNLKWNITSPNVNCYEYVDLGLPSGLKWAKYNYGITPMTTLKGDTDNFTDGEFYATWGSEWRRPTSENFQELIDNCVWEWTTVEGVDGYKVTGPNANYIFLPYLKEDDSSCKYATSSAEIYTSPSGFRYRRHYYLYFNSVNYYVSYIDTKTTEQYPTPGSPTVIGNGFRPVTK